MRLRRGKGIAALALLAGCTAAPAGPVAVPPAGVWAVRVTPLAPAAGGVASIIDPGEVRAIAASEAFAAHGWSATRGEPLAPRYRIDFLGDDGARTSYWVGTGALPS